MKRRTVLLIFTLAFAILTASGCSNTAKTKKANSSGNENTENKNTEPNSESSETDSAASVFEKELFTDRDMDISYDKDSCTRITLDDKKTSCDSDAVKISNTTVTISKEGDYILSGTLSDGMIIVDIDKSKKVHLILDGASVSSSSCAALYIKQADKVFLTTAKNSKNTFESVGDYQAIDDNNIDAAIFSKDDLTLNGAGSLTVKAEVGHGIVSKDTLAITSGEYDITASSHGLSGKDSVNIADGNFKITVGKDGIHSKKSLNIIGGDYQINSDDDGIHADEDVRITNGNINIPKCYEGIEGLTITISGGDISLVSSDDGLNAAGGADRSGFGAQKDEFAASDDIFINISGGTIHMKTSGDGLDSNGNLTISGGEIYISGPESNGNGSLDYNGEGKISGGTVVAAGAMGMAQNFGSTSTQGSMLVKTENGKAGDKISLTDSKGKELLSWQTEAQYSCVLISNPALTKGATYTLKTGDNKQEITLSELIYGEGEMGGGNRGFGGRGGKRPDGEMPNSSARPKDEMPRGSARPEMPNREKSRKQSEETNSNINTSTN